MLEVTFTKRSIWCQRDTPANSNPQTIDETAAILDPKNLAQVGMLDSRINDDFLAVPTPPSDRPMATQSTVPFAPHPPPSDASLGRKGEYAR